MKTRIIAFIVTMILIYLGVAFVTLKIDFTLWSQFTRISYLIYGPILSALVAAFPFLTDN